MDPVTGGVIVATVITFGVGFAFGFAFGCCVVGAYAIWLNQTGRVPVAPGTPANP